MPAKKFFFIPLLFILFASTSWSEKAPLEFDAFDGQTVGARPIGMGEAFAGLANDASAPYWNPAGLALLPSNSFTICSYLRRESNARWDDVIKSDPLRGGKLTYLSFASSNGAFSIRPLSKVANSVYTNENGQEIWLDKNIRINEIMLTRATTNNENFFTGVSLNYLNSNLAVAKRVKDNVSDQTDINVDTGNGWSLDLGLIYAPNPTLTFGLSAINTIGYLYWSDYEKNKLPLVFRSGMAMSLPAKTTFLYEYKKVYYVDHEDISTKHIGLEQLMFGMLNLRAGISGQDWNDAQKVAYTFGIGFNEKGFKLDLAMEKHKISDAVNANILRSVYTYIVSLSTPFGQ